MHKIEKMIKEMCPDGVEVKLLGEVTIWDKRFDGVKKEKQPQVCSFKHVLAADLKAMQASHGNVKLLATGKFDGYTSEETAGDFMNEGEVIAIPSGGSANLKYYNGKFVDSGNILAIAKDETICLKFVWYFLLTKNDLIQSHFRGSAVAHPSMPDILQIPIPLPPLPIQREIVNILDTFTKLEAELEAELEARKKQYEYYRGKLLEFKEVSKWLTIKDIGKICMCKRIFKQQTHTTGDVPFYKIGTFGKEPDAYISNELFEEYKNKFSYPKKGDVLISASGTIGRTVVYDGKPAYFQDSNIVWVDNDETQVTNNFLFHYYKIVKWQTDGGGTIERLYNSSLEKLPIPIPPLPIQREIVTILDKFDKLVNDISCGLPAEIRMRRQQYEYYRNNLLSFD